MVKEGDKSVRANPTYLEWILQAIRKIRYQKQRPSQERIVAAIRQHHQVSEDSIAEQLDLGVKDGSIVSIDNNGLTYRDPANLPKGKARAKKSLDLSKKAELSKAIILCLKRDGSCKGLMLKTIEKAISINYNLQGHPATAQVRMCVRKLIQKGQLQQNGKFIKLATEDDEDDEEEEDDIPSSKIDLEQANLQVVLPFERNRKKANPLPLCSFCLETSEQNRDGNFEELISCADCGNSGHPTCLKFSEHLTERVRHLRWQCINCKKCSFCGKSGKEDDMLFCDFCDRGFHMPCCDPPITKPPKGDWKCNLCDPERGSMKGKKFLEAAMNYSTKVKSQMQATSKQKLKKARLFQAKRKAISLKHRKANRKKTRDKDDDSEDEDHKNVDGDSPSINTCNRGGMVLPTFVSEEDVALFKEAQEITQKDLNEVNGPPVVLQRRTSPSHPELGTETDVPKYPPCIELGEFEIQTWYSSPYPQEYASLPKLYICEYCLKYMKSRTSLQRHFEKCQLRHPPADEIYRHENLSVYEVDGHASKLYCQNLCLLAKLFLDHKTLYYDVEPFLFYVLTINNEYGSHVVGYFSKEKHSQQKYNVSCIMTMPQYMRKGYGRFLIDFSYLLTRQEGITGSPEKPLSALGAVSYRAYWRSVVLEHLHAIADKSLSIKGLSEQTGLCPLDIIQALRDLDFIKQQDEKVVLAINEQVVESHMNKVQAKSRLALNEEKLRWAPVVNKSFLSDDDEEADSQLNEMREVVESIVTDGIGIKDEIKEDATHAALCSPTSPEVDQMDKGHDHEVSADLSIRANSKQGKLTSFGFRISQGYCLQFLFCS